MLLLGLISSKSLLVEYYLVTLISTYKTILYFYALIIRPTDRLAADLQNYPDTGIYCYAARDKMRWLLHRYPIYDYIF